MSMQMAQLRPTKHLETLSSIIEYVIVTISRIMLIAYRSLTGEVPYENPS